MREVWEKALKARSQGYSQQEIDAATNAAVGTDFPTLTRQLMTFENDPDQAAANAGPGLVPSTLQALASGAGLFGAGPKMLAAALRSGVTLPGPGGTSL